MAIFYCNITIISRDDVLSAVAAAAYRAGEIITSEQERTTYTYTHKTGIAYKEILLPESAPAEYKDRATLWNRAEKVEDAQSAGLAIEITVALPMELSLQQNIELARMYVETNFVAHGMYADLCVHDDSVVNPHAHIMLPLTLADTSIIDLDEQTIVEKWSAAWVEAVNSRLEELNLTERIYYRPQGIA